MNASPWKYAAASPPRRRAAPAEGRLLRAPLTPEQALRARHLLAATEAAQEATDHALAQAPLAAGEMAAAVDALAGRFWADLLAGLRLRGAERRVFHLEEAPDGGLVLVEDPAAPPAAGSLRVH
jgi:hypothetical protein